ncbi:MAG: metallophosphoesterase family protein [Chloroflexi bacterium]|nr:metallophosphoesterase family protein [Chloroflexota bacterium]MQC28177.1 metallophosphoesterase [Chloroflexota bacterium]
MRIGLLSDSHLPSMGPELPPEVASAFEGVDLILHAGDIYISDCLDWLERIAPVIAVEVPPAPVVGDPRVVSGHVGRVLDLEGHAVGLVHDLGMRGVNEVIPGVIEKKFPADRSLAGALEDFFGAPVETVVFGHTHLPMVETHRGIVFVNPGSPTLPRFIRKLGTVGIMELTAEGATAEIVDLTTFSA